MRFYYTIFLVFLSFDLIAQQSSSNLLIGEAKFDKALESDTTAKQRITSSIRTLFRHYEEAASLLDTNRREVTDRSVRRFKALFGGNPKIVKDFMEFPPDYLSGASDYADHVMAKLRNEGVVFQVRMAKLIQVQDDNEGYYQAKIEFQKEFFNYLSNQGVPQKTNGKLMYLNMIIDIPKEDLTYARISSIYRRDDGPVGDDYHRYITVEAKTGIVMAKTTPFEAFSDLAQAKNIEVNTSPVIGVSASWRSNKFARKEKGNKWLFLTAGFQLSTFSIKTSLKGYKLNTFSATATKESTVTQPYTRLVDSVYGSQKDRLYIMEAPMGISLRLKKTPTQAYFLDIQFVPQYAIATGGQFSGSARYDGAIVPGQFRFLEDKAINPSFVNGQPDLASPLWSYHVGRSVNLNGYGDTPLKTDVGYSLRLSPVAYFDKIKNNPAWGIMAGIDFSYNLKSPIRHEVSTGKPFAFERNDVPKHQADGLTQSPLQTLYKNSKFSILSLRIGVYWKLITKPLLSF